VVVGRDVTGDWQNEGWPNVETPVGAVWAAKTECGTLGGGWESLVINHVMFNQCLFRSKWRTQLFVLSKTQPERQEPVEEEKGQSICLEQIKMIMINFTHG
jgi:hypothetical protein